MSGKEMHVWQVRRAVCCHASMRDEPAAWVLFCCLSSCIAQHLTFPNGQPGSIPMYVVPVYSLLDHISRDYEF